MAKNVKINNVTYDDVPHVNIPLASGTGTAKFVDTDSGDAAAGDVRIGKKLFANGEEVVGNVPVKIADDVTASGKKVTVPAGIYDAPVEKSVADGTISLYAAVVGDVIGDTVTDYEITATPYATVGAGYVSGDKTGVAAHKYIQVEDKVATPGVTAVVVTPSAGKLIKKCTINPVSIGGNASPSDVINGKTFLSAGSLDVKTGTATVPHVSQDSSTKVLTIS